jgi:hypothetical protein
MRKLLYITLLVLPIFVFGAVGVSPQSEPADFNFVIPEIVGVQINEANIEWDFSSMAGFPPAAFPVYYEPTSPAARPYQTIDYLVWGFGSTSWELTIEGNGPPGTTSGSACGIDLSDIEYAEDDGGGTLTGLWIPLSTTATAVQTGSASTGGWATMYQDYQVNIDGDETNTSGSSCTVTYTIQTL